MQPRFFSPFHLLAILSAIGLAGGVLLVLWGWFAEFLSPAVGYRALLTSGGSSADIALQLLLSVSVAIAGVVIGYLSFTTFSRPAWSQSAMGKRWYVHFLNKLYFDEMYEVYVVRPTVRFAHWLWQAVDRQVVDGMILGIARGSVLMAKWLWRVVDLRGIDGLVVGLGRNSIGLAGWLWRVVDLRGVDRVVVAIGKRSMGIANWLWKSIDIKVIDTAVNRVGNQAEATGNTISELEPRTVRHHLLVMIFWLIVGMILLFWVVA